VRGLLGRELWPARGVRQSSGEMVLQVPLQARRGCAPRADVRVRQKPAILRAARLFCSLVFRVPLQARGGGRREAQEVV